MAETVEPTDRERLYLTSMAVILPFALPMKAVVAEGASRIALLLPGSLTFLTFGGIVSLSSPLENQNRNTVPVRSRPALRP